MLDDGSQCDHCENSFNPIGGFEEHRRDDEHFRVDVNAAISWVAGRDPLSEAWIAACDPLGLTVEAETWSELLGTIEEVQDHMFRTLLVEGTPEHFLRDRGWEMAGPMPTDVDDPRAVRFDVPIQLLIDHERVRARA